MISAVHGWRDGFVVGETHVLPAYQGQGLGRSLITALLHPAPDATCAVLNPLTSFTAARGLYGVGAQLVTAGVAGAIHDVGGFRTSKGASGAPIPYSMHQFGAAIDINEASQPWHTLTLPAKLIRIMEANRWFWGGHWGGASRDPGHFQFTGCGGKGAVSIGGRGVAARGPVQKFAQRLLASYGWSSQWPAFNALVVSESGWNPLISNPASGGGYGIPQALPGSKMASAGTDWRTSPYTQLRWMLNYIRMNLNFHDPASAWAFHQAHNWYARGGPISEPISGIGMRTGQGYTFGEAGGEYVSSQADMKTMCQLLAGISGQMRALLKITEVAPSRTARGVGAAINGTAQNAYLGT